MRSFVPAVLIVFSSAPAVLRADVTIRYKSEIVSPIAQIPGKTTSSVIYMKGNKGVTVSDGQTMIADFARQQVTILDTARKKFATIPASEYGAKMSAQMTSLMPQQSQPMVAEMLKSMKTTCDTKQAGLSETIQGVQAEAREIDCDMSISMPDSVKSAAMPPMGMKFVMRIWTASPAERMRVPGLWQLSSFELWQKYFINPAGSLGAMMPEGMKPMLEAMQKDQSATLRMTMEATMQMPIPGMAADGKGTPLIKMNMEIVGLSTELLDDSLFAVPADFSAEPFETVMSGITGDAIQSVKAETAKAEAAMPKAVIPENVKAFVPSLTPVSQSRPAAPLDANGKKVQGMVELLVTVGPKGKVEQAEALSGPEALRKVAVDAVTHWTYRPVIRDGAPVTAYTDAIVNFTDYSKGVPAGGSPPPPDIMAAAERIRQLKLALPRTPEQEFADLEQAAGGDKTTRYDHLGDLAVKAVELGHDDKAKAYADELLASAQQDAGGWNYGNAILKGHMVLGLLALHSGDVATARKELIESGKTTGSPTLNSFGPNMTLAAELLKKGDRDAVLDYFEMCRKFWKMGGNQLDSWSQTVRNGGVPDFGANLVY